MHRSLLVAAATSLASLAHAQCELTAVLPPYPHSASPAEVAIANVSVGSRVAIRSPDLAGVLLLRRVGSQLVMERLLDADDLPCGVATGDVALDGDRVAFGGNCSGAGVVHLHRFVAGSWIHEATLTQPPGSSDALTFGAALALRGNRLLVGELHRTVSGHSWAGAMHVYDFDGIHWNLTATLTLPRPQSSEVFGAEVALGDEIAVGSAFQFQNPNSIQRPATVFRLVGGVWTLEQALQPLAVPADVHVYGSDVGTPSTGSFVVLGGFIDNHAHLWIFEKVGATWQQTSEIFGDDGPAFTGFGGNLALDPAGHTMLVRDAMDDSSGVGTGAVYAFRRDGDRWIETAKFAPLPAGWFGSDLAVDAGFGVVADQLFGPVRLLGGLGLVDCNGNGTDDACDIADGRSDDRNNNLVPDECELSADLDADGVVGATDLAILLGAWGACLACPSDLDASGAVDAADLALLLGAWGGPACGGEDCCIPHAAPGCAETTCCALVCASDPYCCVEAWDAACVAAAQFACRCPPPASCGAEQDCCQPSRAPGCLDAACCTTICTALDPTCCTVAWDATCVEFATYLCAACAVDSYCVDNPNDCCVESVQGYPGCNDVLCCALICAVDPFCCEVAWDGLCAADAQLLCEVCEP